MQIYRRILALRWAWRAADQEVRHAIIRESAGWLKRRDSKEALLGIEVLALLLNDDIFGFDAALALAHLGDERALQHLSRLEEIAAPWNLAAAITALGELGGSRSLELIRQILTDLPQHATTWAATESEREQYLALIRSDVATSLAKIGGTEVVPLLIKLVMDAIETVRWSAVNALQQVGAVAVEPLMAELQTAQNEDARWSILWALNKLDDPRAQAAVEAARTLPKDDV